MGSRGKASVIVVFSKNPTAVKIMHEPAMRAGFLVSDTFVRPGRLGQPIHGDVLVTVFRKINLLDPIPSLQSAHSESCASLRAILDRVPKALAEGWAALSKDAYSVKIAAATPEALKTAADAQAELGMLPQDFKISDHGLNLDAVGQVRLAALLSWMKSQDSNTGCVDTANPKKPFHVDGTCPELYTTRGLFVCTLSDASKMTVKMTQLQPLDKMMILGYSASAENISVVSWNGADALVSQATPMHIVYCTMLAVLSVLPAA
jgi:hypothetical protein